MLVHHSSRTRGALVVAAVVALALLLGATSTAWCQTTDSEQVRSQRISLNLQNVTLGSVLKVMTQKSGINFLIGSDLVGKTINVYLEDVLVEDALAAIMRANALAARERQHERFDDSIRLNGQMGQKHLKAHCQLGDPTAQLLHSALNDMGLSARAHDKILRVARTIADLDRAERIEYDHMAEAINYRSLDRNLWA